MTAGSTSRSSTRSQISSGRSTGSRSWPAAAPTTRRLSRPRRSRTGRACRPERRLGRSSATARRRWIRGRWSSPSPSPGETADTIAPTRHAREQGCPIVAVTNTVGSAITREADAVVFLQAGPEIAVAASKTFVTQVTTLVILAAAIARIRGNLGAEQELRAGQTRSTHCRPPRNGRSMRPPWTPMPWHAATSTRVASCSSAAATPTRRRSRAPSSSRRSATSTPRDTRRASSSTVRSPSSMPNARSSPWRPARRSTRS